MDQHNGWTELQQHSLNSIASSVDPYAQFYNCAYPHSSSSSYTHYPYQHLPHQPQIPNPNFSDPQTLTGHNGAIQEASLWQPLTGDSYSTVFYPSHVGADAQSALGYAHHQQNQDSLGATQCSAKQKVQHQYVAEPVSYSNVGTEILTRPEPVPVVPTQPIPLYWNNNPVSVTGSKRKFPKKAKIVQSAWCEICKIDCNSSDVLNKHRLGKKHKKNLENLIGNTNTNTNKVIAPTVSKNKNKPPPSIQQSKKKEDADLETKKRKIVQGGAAAEAVRVCSICNVACNSETVFHYHLTGQKHAAMVKKHTNSTTGV